MKKITFALLSIFVVSSFGTSHVMAKSSSGGGTPVESAPVEAAPTSVAEAPAPAAPIVTPKSEAAPIVAPKSDKPVPAAPVSVPPKTAPASKEEVICSKLEDLEKRVRCRVGKTEEEFKIELTPENYFPEGCRWGTSEWQEKCKDRYRIIHPLYSLPIGQERMLAIKEALGLPEKLVKPSVFCEGGEASCVEDYKNKVVNLIVARFYDLEQRLEELNAEGKVTDEQLIDMVVKISQAKVDFYGAKTQADPNAARAEIIKALQVDWNALLKGL